MDLDRLIDPHDNLVQDRADDLQLPLKPSKDDPVLILKDLTLAGEAV
jgi:hypothetical protein